MERTAEDVGGLLTEVISSFLDFILIPIALLGLLSEKPSK